MEVMEPKFLSKKNLIKKVLLEKVLKVVERDG
jgi:hypothetical protein